MTFLLWIIVGAIAGWLASMVTGEDEAMGPIMNIIVGVVGSFVAGTLLVLFRTGSFDINAAFTGFDLFSVLAATVGAIILLLVLKAFRRSPATA